MPGTSELIDFRRAFVWLLCGMLLPSVALIAFGVVAVVNERVAVERRLEIEYGARLRTLDADVRARLHAAAGAAAAEALARAGGPRTARGGSRRQAVEREPPNARPPARRRGAASAERGDGSPASDPVAAPRAEPLLLGIAPVQVQGADPVFADAVRRAQALAPGGHVLAASDAGGDRHLFALVRVPGPPEAGVLAAQLDLVGVAAEIPRLAAARFPRESATFRLLPPTEHGGATIATLRRLLNEVSPPDRTTIVARLPLQPPLDGFTLAAEISGDDPAASLAFRNRTWYIAALALLYTGIGVGFGLTIREMRRAYKLSRLKTDFVANISHELRTPLTSVRLFAETLKQGRAQGPREVQECLDLLTKETQRLSSLVEKLLDWSRLESGRKLLRREPTEVPALLAHVADVFKAQQLGATYETHIEADLPKVSLDRDAMAQVVLNLLHNAVKFTGPDKQIRLRARRRDGGVAIEVEDNGIGVREKDRKRIFERFYRSDDLLSRRTEGTGLGLAIAKRLVEAHGGRIDVEARAGSGSVFRVQLPANA
ncbi:MAG: two-component sensor histidine kinase [Deltaproteobacteria bacterium]|nr:MAG: two-component sensor histidine kinase [Deltaproteobacteria bacterium]